MNRSASHTRRSPITPHKGSGKWQKRLDGKVHCFGRLDNSAVALAEYNAYVRKAVTGKLRNEDPTKCNVDFMVNRWLAGKLVKVDEGSLSNRTYLQCKHAAKIMKEHFGTARAVETITADDMSEFWAGWAKDGLSPTAINNRLRCIKMILRYAYEAGYIDRPLRLGEPFDSHATDLIMGHDDHSIQARYRECFDNERIKRVCEAVRAKVSTAQSN
ncbi:hypothetical protein [Crateriforma conspicua]|uniref:hypothetical protein n=1 Tax=Crateriforma conspicua TaxID=2527996 RepID=UPI00118D0750|nr:hypothetical protein [Crateriforma conspicua]QDV63781.1 hypothetical protein Mal65_29270 [Crateriforma conspicua]